MEDSGMDKIVLTPEELDEIKDTTKFRTKVLLELKLLRGVPNKVLKLGIHIGFQWFFISCIIIIILGIALGVK